MSFQLSQENKNFKEKIIQPLPVEEPTVEESPQEPAEALSTQEEVKQEQPKEIKQDKSLENNMRALREKSEKITRERDEFARKLQELESQKQNDSDITIANEDLVEGKHIKQVTSEIKQLKSQLNEYKNAISQVTVETKLKNTYPDFESVVTPDNVESLRQSYPELAATIASSSDLYSKAVSAYTMIKKMGIIPDSKYDADKQVVQKNTQKPRPLTSISPQEGDSPLSRANAFANGLTTELKEQLRKEMFEHRKSF